MSDNEGPAQFASIMSLIASSCGCRQMGLAMVPQEGANAGIPEKINIPSNEKWADESHEVANHCVSLLLHENSHKNSTKAIEKYLIVPLIGQFSTEIAYLWFDIKTTPSDEIVQFLADHILRTVENSKKSMFHNFFTKNMEQLSSTSLYDSIARTIRDGLYCDKVIIWKRDRGTLRSMNERGLDVSLAGSLAGFSHRNGDRTYNDVSKVPPESIENARFIKREKIQSAFFFRIGKLTVDQEKGAGGVVGVFYRRRHGTTKIDKLLCRFAIDYYDLVWNQREDIEELQNENAEFEQIRPFYRDAIKCLVDFHDLTAIQMGLSEATSTALVTAHNRPDIEVELRVISGRLRDLKNLISKNSGALTIAPKFADLISDDMHLELVNLHDLFNEEVDKIEREASEARAQIRREYRINTSSARIVKEDYVKVLSNLLTNAIRAVSRRQQGGGMIKVAMKQTGETKISISVEDNGPGVPTEDQGKIFDVHFTTHGAEGGKGIGLAVVKSVARKHRGTPKFKSKWGNGAFFSVDLSFQTKS